MHLGAQDFERYNARDLHRQSKLNCSKRLLFSNINKWITMWNMTVVLLAMLNSVLVPFDIATESEHF